MSDVVITAIISGLCVAIPSITATITANKRNQELLTFQIQEIKSLISLKLPFHYMAHHFCALKVYF